MLQKMKKQFVPRVNFNGIRYERIRSHTIVHHSGESEDEEEDETDYLEMKVEKGKEEEEEMENDYVQNRIHRHLWKWKKNKNIKDHVTSSYKSTKQIKVRKLERKYTKKMKKNQYRKLMNEVDEKFTKKKEEKKNKERKGESSTKSSDKKKKVKNKRKLDDLQAGEEDDQETDNNNVSSPPPKKKSKYDEITSALIDFNENEDVSFYFPIYIVEPLFKNPLYQGSSDIYTDKYIYHHNVGLHNIFRIKVNDLFDSINKVQSTTTKKEVNNKKRPLIPHSNEFSKDKRISGIPPFVPIIELSNQIIEMALCFMNSEIRLFLPGVKSTTPHTENPIEVYLNMFHVFKSLILTNVSIRAYMLLHFGYLMISMYKYLVNQSVMTDCIPSFANYYHSPEFISHLEHLTQVKFHRSNASNICRTFGKWLVYSSSIDQYLSRSFFLFKFLSAVTFQLSVFPIHLKFKKARTPTAQHWVKLLRFIPTYSAQITLHHPSRFLENSYRMRQKLSKKGLLDQYEEGWYITKPAHELFATDIQTILKRYLIAWNHYEDNLHDLECFYSLLTRKRHISNKEVKKYWI